MPEAKSAAYRRTAKIVINEIVFETAYNPFAMGLMDYRKEEALTEKPTASMTEDDLEALFAFRAELLARMVVTWDFTAYGIVVPIAPESILAALDPVFVKGYIDAIIEDMSPKAGGESMSTDAPPASGEAKTDSASTKRPRRPRNSATASSPTDSSGPTTSS